MTEEQKARAYDEALERTKSWVRGEHPECTEAQKAAKFIFPELRESEDERTRKRIIALVNAHGQGMYKDEMLAWLEKQGEK